MVTVTVEHVRLTCEWVIGSNTLQSCVDAAFALLNTWT